MSEILEAGRQHNGYSKKERLSPEKPRDNAFFKIVFRTADVLYHCLAFLDLSSSISCTFSSYA